MQVLQKPKIAFLPAFSVDFSEKKIGDLIQEAGCQTDPRILLPGKFRLREHRGTAQLELRLVSFEYRMVLDEVLEGLDNVSLRPADLVELAALITRFPDEQRKSAIFAFDSICQESAAEWLAPIAAFYENQRILRAFNCKNVTFNEKFSFAAVKL